MRGFVCTRLQGEHRKRGEGTQQREGSSQGGWGTPGGQAPPCPTTPAFMGVHILHPQTTSRPWSYAAQILAPPLLVMRPQEECSNSPCLNFLTCKMQTLLTLSHRVVTGLNWLTHLGWEQ